MITVHSDRHRLQDGRIELLFDKLGRPFERPERVDIIVKHIRDTGLGQLVEPTEFGVDPILRVHDRNMVRFVERAWDLWKAAHGDCDALPPSSCARGMRPREPESIEGKLSFYAADTGTAITAGTWQAVCHSVDVALTGLKILTERKEGGVFSLCRPPGHHAMPDYYGGYCFFNNVAIAAQAALDAGAGRIAVVDVDYHHGNGTQTIFYGRGDVFFVSLHADPAFDYPYFLGYADERGHAAGEGCNLNLPMPRGTNWSVYGQAMDHALAQIRDYGPDLLLVSLGVDTFEQDPISEFRLTHDDYRSMGEAIARLRLPTLFVMEGGYAIDALGVNVCNVLSGFEQGD